MVEVPLKKMVSSFLDKEHQMVSLFNSGDILNQLIDYVYQDFTEEQREKQRDTFANLAQQGNLKELVSKFLLKLIPELSNGSKVKKSNDRTLKEMETVFSIIFSLMRHLSPEQLDEAVTSFCKDMRALKGSTDPEARRLEELKIKVLQNCHNMLGLTQLSKMETFTTCLQLGIQSALSMLIVEGEDGLGEVELQKVCEKWKLSPIQKMQVYRLICDAVLLLDAPAATNERKLSFLQPFLMLLEEVQHEKEGSKYAKATGLLAVKDCFRFYNDLSLNLADIFQGKCFQQLSSDTSDPENKVAYCLVESFTSADLSRFGSLSEDNLVAVGYSPEEQKALKDDLRVLALGKLGSKSNTISYEAIAEFLEIDTSEVERWVVRAVGYKVLDAKLDQLQAQVVITSGTRPQELYLASNEVDLARQTDRIQRLLDTWSNSVLTAKAALPAASKA